MLRQQVFIDARLVVEAFQISSGNEAIEVLVAFLILAEKHEVVVTVGLGLVVAGLLRDVDFTADDGLDVLGLGGVIELDGAEEVAVIRHRHGGHVLFGHNVHELGNLAGSVEQRVVGMAVQVDEGCVRHRADFSRNAVLGEERTPILLQL